MRCVPQIFDPCPWSCLFPNALPQGRQGSRWPKEAQRVFLPVRRPAGADVVIMQENTESVSDRVRILQSAVAGENLRMAGEDISTGARLFAAGHRLQPQDLGLLAAAGIDKVIVVREPRLPC